MNLIVTSYQVICPLEEPRPFSIATKFRFSSIILQAAVLLLFNSADKLSYSDIKNELNLTDEDITRLLHSLACNRYKILIKDPSSKSVGQTDTFEFNAQFFDRLRKIKVRTFCADLAIFFLPQLN